MKEIILNLPAIEAYTDEILRERLRQASGISKKNWVGYIIKKRSVDARKKKNKGTSCCARL